MYEKWTLKIGQNFIIVDFKRLMTYLKMLNFNPGRMSNYNQILIEGVLYGQAQKLGEGSYWEILKDFGGKVR